jgi:hypothetical protein
MKFSTLASSILLSGIALAAPLSEKNLTRRDEYNPTWAGAVLTGSEIHAVTGTFVVPSITVPDSGDSTQLYCISAWVGIDGYGSASQSILQTGVRICIQNGQITNTPWFEWYPASEMDWASGITINTGDSISATVSATSSTGGTATITNNSNGQSVSSTFIDQSPGLIGASAEWIVEDSSTNGGLVNFANFGSDFTFTGAMALSSNGPVDTTGSTIVDIEENNNVITSSTASGGQVVISYL